MSTQTAEAVGSLGRRERNKQKVKERLYSSALTLFREQGYDGTSIDQIAERADVARGTFFNYFQRKEDIISAWGERRREKLMSSMSNSTPVRPGTSLDELWRCMNVLSEINEDERDLTAPMLTAWVKAGRPLVEEPYVADIFTRIVSQGYDSGELAGDVNAQRVGHILRDIYLGTLYRWCQQTSAAPGYVTEELQAALRLVVYGLLTAPQSQVPPVAAGENRLGNPGPDERPR
ncbi:TetR/AcrR family transcriptional regulator [Streptomyces sp. NPDC005423]|uniref:TetR/AcrR family transcriptional regulator n=1 Tax=Streptomyces sp. NPDC005423 TaxID=3155343 RepID=UPI0033A1E159